MGLPMMSLLSSVERLYLIMTGVGEAGIEPATFTVTPLARGSDDALLSLSYSPKLVRRVGIEPTGMFRLKGGCPSIMASGA